MTVHIVFGPQGAGKTTLAQSISKTHRATAFSVDEWMSSLYLPDMPQPLDLSWILARVERCRELIWKTAHDIVSHGGAVVLDLGMQTRSDRVAARSLLEQHGLRSTWYFVTAPANVRRNRVLTRNADQGTTFSFEVTPQMFDFMDVRFEAPAPDELVSCAVVDTSS